ncbi:MAG: DUF502 domain-containing protein [Chlamydiae bacterium]|nr:DUF502 domain-containing protein [Chlamydiota bacterium]
MKKYFVTGLVILLPLTLTIFAIKFFLNLLTKPFMGIVDKLIHYIPLDKWHIKILSHEQIVHYGSGLIILVSLFLLILILGFLAKVFFFNALISFSDSLIKKIPLVNKVYKTTQEIIKTLFVTDKNSFKYVAMVPFPHKGAYCLGLISRSTSLTIEKETGKELVSVFVPTTPNITTGFLVMFKKEDLIYVDIKTEDAIKYVVSCGVITPPKEEEK